MNYSTQSYISIGEMLIFQNLVLLALAPLLKELIIILKHLVLD